MLGKHNLEMAINSAVLHYNDGTEGVKNVLKSFGISGMVTDSKSNEHNIERIQRQEVKSGEKFKKRRKTLRKIKKGHVDKETQNEKPSYVPGGFD